jgi:hypothetical protein
VGTELSEVGMNDILRTLWPPPNQQVPGSNGANPKGALHPRGFSDSPITMYLSLPSF